MNTSKTLRVCLLFIFSISLFPSSQGQILKRLKRKIERKVENKIERKVDKTIDDAIDGEPKNKEKTQSNEANKSESYPQKNETKDYGDVNISSNKHEAIGIGKIGKVRVFQTENSYRISGSWWTHDADIPDGFTLEIKDVASLKTTDNPQKTKFKIPDEATLHLAYDPSMPHNKSMSNDQLQAVTDKYISFDISKGEVSIYTFDDNTIHFGFSGDDGLKGSLQGHSIEFIKEDAPRQSSSNVASNESSPSLPIFNRKGKSSSSAGTYNFTYEFVNEIKTDSDDQTYQVSYLFNPNASYFGMVVDMSKYSEEPMSGESIIIYDEGDSYILVETQGMKIQLSSQMAEKQQKSMPTEQFSNYDYSNIKKTGATKSILGYTCYEYQLTDNENKLTMWVAPDFKIPNWFMQQQEQITEKSPLEGYVLEYYSESPDGKVSMKTIKIDENINKKVVGSEYRKMF